MVQAGDGFGFAAPPRSNEVKLLTEAQNLTWSQAACNSRLLWIPWALALLSLSAFCVLALVGWPGTFSAAGRGFCEAFREGAIRQPANTWSNLGFVVAGLWMTRRVGLDLANPDPPRNLIGRSTGLSILYATLVVMLGPGSMAMHGSGTAWGGTTDVFAMLAYIAFPVAYAAVRLVGGGARAFAWLYAVPLAVLGTALVTGTLPFSGSTLYAWLIPAFAGLELWVGFRRSGGSRDLRWLGLAGGVFLTGLVIWRLSHTGAPLCYPESLLQGHAIWHVLCAVSTAAIFVYYQSEHDPQAM
jgi:hypothetical protein